MDSVPLYTVSHIISVIIYSFNELIASVKYALELHQIKISELVLIELCSQLHLQT